VSLSEIKIEILHSIFDILGITQVDCLDLSTYSNESEFGERVFATGKIIQNSSLPVKLQSCVNTNDTVSQVTFLSMVGLKRLNNRKNSKKWMESVASFLRRPNVMVSLHSYSFFKKILHLSCFDSFSRVKIEVDSLRLKVALAKL
jgi:hypothetical protein